MFFRDLKNVLSKQDNSKPKVRYIKDVLHRLGNLKKNDLALAGKEEPVWFKIINPVFTDSNLSI